MNSIQENNAKEKSLKVDPEVIFLYFKLYMFENPAPANFLLKTKSQIL